MMDKNNEKGSEKPSKIPTFVGQKNEILRARISCRQIFNLWNKIF